MSRTFLVWVIFVLSVTGFLLQVGSIVFLYSGIAAWPREAMAELNAISSDEIAMNLLVSAYWLFAAGALFMMRRIALPFFLIGIPIELVQYGWTAYFHGWEMVAGTREMAFLALSIAISLLICFYVWTLDRRGMLA